MEAKVGLDTFCHPEALFSKEVVKDDEVRVAEKECKRVPLGATEEKNEVARWEAKLEQEGGACERSISAHFTTSKRM